jgi:nucleoside-diphosphate-sugar epimerase
MAKTLFTFGQGYTATALARRLIAQGWQCVGTSRTPEGCARIKAEGIAPLRFPGSDVSTALATATHLLISTAPGANGDPVLAEIGTDIAQLTPNLEWVGYLSTTGVYGDHAGGWVDETTPLTPATPRGEARVKAEAAWRAQRLPLHIFRLAGIYGPGRAPFDRLRAGTARRIIKPGQVFSRIHVDDITQALLASIARPAPGAIYNICDDEPAPPQDVLTYAAKLLDLPPPPEEAFATADMSAMARSFYAESKRVRNDRMKADLGVKLLYPTYRDGLKAILQTG